MSLFVNPLKSTKAKLNEEIQQQIYKHKADAMSLTSSIKNYTEVVKHSEEGDYELAMLSAVEANNNSEMAIEKQRN